MATARLQKQVDRRHTLWSLMAISSRRECMRGAAPGERADSSLEAHSPVTTMVSPEESAGSGERGRRRNADGERRVRQRASPCCHSEGDGHPQDGKATPTTTAAPAGTLQKSRASSEAEGEQGRIRPCASTRRSCVRNSPTQASATLGALPKPRSSPLARAPGIRPETNFRERKTFSAQFRSKRQ